MIYNLQPKNKNYLNNLLNFKKHFSKKKILKI